MDQQPLYGILSYEFYTQILLVSKYTPDQVSSYFNRANKNCKKN